MRDSLHQLTDVGSFPVDSSPYGVLDLGGNVRDFCLDRYRPGGAPVRGQRVELPVDPEPDANHVVRGGVWLGGALLTRCANRHQLSPTLFAANYGFRVARTWSADDHHPGVAADRDRMQEEGS